MDERSNTADVKQVPTTRHGGAWRHVLLALVIFICGILVGAGASVWVIHRGMMKVMGHGMLDSGVIIDHIDSKLDLTTEQEQQVREIFDREFATVRDTRREMSAEMRIHYERIRDDVAAVLTDEQRAVWMREIAHAEKMFRPLHGWHDEGSAHVEHGEHVADHAVGHGDGHVDGEPE